MKYCNNISNVPATKLTNSLPPDLNVITILLEFYGVWSAENDVIDGLVITNVNRRLLKIDFWLKIIC